ncbi:PREDICTED: uncharacterized protein LOC108780823 [Cyphomyrmex costatus]|uniref:uncharacterized protein LOC108780823 n=1 Tax=Cyphomyrmex costatus TaxID=456900 RepID=UPI00085238B3|nr:PREDICTED: uncharacterized protein LOC108780823 [Cyphomyrmex costatus]
MNSKRRYKQYLLPDSNVEIPRTTLYRHKKKRMKIQMQENSEDSSVSDNERARGENHDYVPKSSSAMHRNSSTTIHENLSNIMEVGEENVSRDETPFTEEEYSEVITKSSDDSSTSESDNDAPHEKIHNNLNYNERHDSRQPHGLPHDKQWREYVCECRKTTCGEALLMCMTIGMRHNLSWVAIMDILKMINNIFDVHVVPDTKYYLQKHFPIGIENTIKYHVFCPTCTEYIGEKNDNDIHECNCGSQFKSADILKWFIELSFEDQLRNLLQNRNIQESLNHTFNREEKDSENLQDIYDGRGYKKLKDVLGTNKWNITYTFSTDGCQSANASNVSI